LNFCLIVHKSDLAHIVLVRLVGVHPLDVGEVVVLGFGEEAGPFSYHLSFDVVFFALDFIEMSPAGLFKADLVMGGVDIICPAFLFSITQGFLEVCLVLINSSLALALRVVGLFVYYLLHLLFCVVGFHKG